ncbi:MAG TPA: hypothetical protein VGI39_31670 [Polyangiaceae bacterium]|jgi:hypothetical protein
MKETTLSVPELGLVAVTRAILGMGVGLLVAKKLSDAQRKPLGWAMVAIGAVTTIPLALEVFGGKRVQPVEKEPELEVEKVNSKVVAANTKATTSN